MLKTWKDRWLAQIILTSVAFVFSILTFALTQGGVTTFASIAATVFGLVTLGLIVFNWIVFKEYSSRIENYGNIKFSKFTKAFNFTNLIMASVLAGFVLIFTILIAILSATYSSGLANGIRALQIIILLVGLGTMSTIAINAVFIGLQEPEVARVKKAQIEREKNEK